MADPEVVADKLIDAPAKDVPETPPGRVSVGDSVRAALEKVAKPEPDKPEGDRPRAADGKFAPKQAAEVPAAEATPAPAAKPKAPEGEGAPETPETPPRPAIRAPQSLKTELKSAWDKLDPQWQGEIDRLEREAKKKFDRDAQAVQFAQAISAEFQPYEATLRSLGATPAQALRSFLNTDYQLRSGTPAQKAQVLFGLAQHYGVDLSGISQGQVPQVDPNVASLQQRLDAMERARQQEVVQRTNAESAQVTSAIQAFAADPKHEHFEDVRVHMGALMQTGVAQDLDDAYKQACWANPTIRDKLIHAQEVEREAKRKADERKAVEAKKAAGVSVKGNPASPISAAPGKKESVRDTITRVSANAGGRI